MQRTDPWEVLGIAPTTDMRAIKSAYRGQLHAAHPDCGGSREAFDAVRSAFREVARQARADHKIANQRIVSTYANDVSPSRIWDVGTRIARKSTFDDLLYKALIEMNALLAS